MKRKICSEPAETLCFRGLFRGNGKSGSVISGKGRNEICFCGRFEKTFQKYWKNNKRHLLMPFEAVLNRNKKGTEIN